MPRTGPSTALTLGKYNVYAPSTKAYAAFDTLKEAQSAVKAQKSGVILDPAGKLDPKIQKWSGWSTYQSTFPAAPLVLNPGARPGAHTPSTSGGPIAFADAPRDALRAAPKPNTFNVWFSAYQFKALGLSDTSHLPGEGGAYLAFKSLAEAQAHVKERRFGVILGPKGEFDVSAQAWDSAAQGAAMRLNAQLTTAATPRKVNVWFPPALISTLGLADPKPVASQGAYLPFDSLAEAQAHVQARKAGLILGPAGDFDASVQKWSEAGKYSLHRLNARLQSTLVPNTVNVWFRVEDARALGVADSTVFAKGGAYLPFDSVAEAQEHVRARRLGVILGPGGTFDVGQQMLSNAARLLTERLNAQLTKAPTPNAINVWFPPDHVPALGLGDACGPFLSKGAYLAFPTVEEAKAHVQDRTVGVLSDGQGKFLEGAQVWSRANYYRPAAAHWPPPALGAEAQVPAADGDLLGVYARATPTGAQVVVRTHNAQPGETLRYELFVTVNGKDMKLKDLGWQTVAAGAYVNDATFELNYAEFDAILSVLQPGLKVTQGETRFGVMVSWPEGHNQGANGAGGAGNHAFVAA